MLFADVPAPPVPQPDPIPTQPTGPAKPGKEKGMVADPDFILWSVVLAGVLLLAAMVVFFIDRWRKRPTGATARDDVAGYSNFKQLYENGEITEAEYDRIRAKMAAKMKASLGVSPPAPPAVPPEPPPPPPAE